MIKYAQYALETTKWWNKKNEYNNRHKKSQQINDFTKFMLSLLTPYRENTILTANVYVCIFNILYHNTLKQFQPTWNASAFWFCVFAATTDKFERHDM